MNYNNVSNVSLNEKLVSFRFSLAILFAVFLFIPACNAVSGAYSDDPYGPVVNCDSTLPMNELLKCVDKKYAQMDTGYNLIETKADGSIRFYKESNK